MCKRQWLYEYVCDQVIRWKLDSIGMNPTAESYLLLHRFGTVSINSIFCELWGMLYTETRTFKSVLCIWRH